MKPGFTLQKAKFPSIAMRLCIVSFLFSTMVSCGYINNNKKIESALEQAGNNRKELEKVIEHYKGKPEDSLKLKAAYFLIENMPGHFSYDTTNLYKYRPVIEKIGLLRNKGFSKETIKEQVYQVYLNYNFIGPGPLAQMVQEREIEAINQVLPLGYKAQKPESFFYWNVKDKKQYWLLLLIIVIIYFITAILFESLLKPLAVISLIPISFIGVFLTFYLFGFNFDQGGFASFILLSGLVVNAAIYIINDFNNLVERKNRPITAKTYLKAFNQKITAIGLTILSTVLGLVPFVWGGQSEVFWFAFAAGAMGGLLFSMVAIIFYLPIFLKLAKAKS